MTLSPICFLFYLFYQIEIDSLFEKEAKDKAPVKEEPGFLTIVCNPYCDDVLDQGRSLGPSPIVHLSAKPGQHRITLKKGTQQKVISVIVESGKVAAQRVSMK